MSADAYSDQTVSLDANGAATAVPVVQLASGSQEAPLDVHAAAAAAAAGDTKMTLKT